MFGQDVHRIVQLEEGVQHPLNGAGEIPPRAKEPVRSVIDACSRQKQCYLRNRLRLVGNGLALAAEPRDVRHDADHPPVDPTGPRRIVVYLEAPTLAQDHRCLLFELDRGLQRPCRILALVEAPSHEVPRHSRRCHVPGLETRAVDGVSGRVVA